MDLLKGSTADSKTPSALDWQGRIGAVIYHGFCSELGPRFRWKGVCLRLKRLWVANLCYQDSFCQSVNRR